MVLAEFYIYKVAVDPVSGMDELTSLNLDGESFKLGCLIDEMRALYAEEGRSASPDHGVVIHSFWWLLPGFGREQYTALSYAELKSIIDKEGIDRFSARQLIVALKELGTAGALEKESQCDV